MLTGKTRPGQDSASTYRVKGRAQGMTNLGAGVQKVHRSRGLQGSHLLDGSHAGLQLGSRRSVAELLQQSNERSHTVAGWNGRRCFAGSKCGSGLATGSVPSGAP